MEEMWMASCRSYEPDASGEGKQREIVLVHTAQEWWHIEMVQEVFYTASISDTKIDGTGEKRTIRTERHLLRLSEEDGPLWS